MSSRTDLDLTAIKAALELEQAELITISAAAADERRPVELDQQSVGRLSRMDALQVQAMAQATEVRRQVRGLRIKAALARLEAGEYSYCVECGDEIPAARLDIDPTSPRCIDCSK
ncbi:MAG TPA: TraR/DksA C4-type zinc finger protein [Alphaproteobacteria bacterium]|nr:TraR/DksA C4-type zinc finger protein [Alphaproteobacteria bacterium]